MTGMPFPAVLTTPAAEWVADDVDVRPARAAVERVGGQFEGVRRSWSRSSAPGEDRLLRDSARYSILTPQRPACRSRLRQQFARGTVSAAEHGGGTCG
ncbi:hypothetical protein ACN27G_09820 [Plantactinospora sp. WMMB334]|uniref:hypothetical protein n=1 Tax=Plantactinospora sp. WMMB334 TaxID=3404119 RepID=UPI003B9642AE